MTSAQTRNPILKPVDTKIPRSWQWPLRVIWIIAAIIGVTLWSLGTYQYAIEQPPDCTEVACDPFALSAQDMSVIVDEGLPLTLLRGFWIATTILLALPILGLAVVIFWLRSDDWLALLVSFTLIFIGSIGFTESDDALFRGYPGLHTTLDISLSAGWISLVVLLFVFPDGRFVPRGRIARWVLGLLLAVMAAPAGGVARNSSVSGSLILLTVGCGLAAQVYRYLRLSSATQRQQTKWVVLGLLGSLGLMVVWFGTGRYLPPDVASPTRVYAMIGMRFVIVGLILVLPISLGFSILRYRLWDIDLIIRRTLTYAVVTTLLALIYFGGVVGLQALIAQLTGGESALSVVASTLTIAALFNPLRNRIQSFIDRRFDRRKYDAQQTLEQFGDIARDEVDLEELEHALLGTISSTMQPSHISLWLAQNE